MASGIVSVAASEQGATVFSDVLLAFACVAWLLVAAATARRASRVRRPRLHVFALVAATAVLGARLALAGESTLALVLWIVAVTSWVLLLAVRPSLAEVSGGSLILVVSTESLAVLAAVLSRRWNGALADVALAAWVLGLGLYVPVVGAVAQASRRQRRFEPDHWIVMGALAITTLAGSELLVRWRGLSDVDLATWALASALILPLLVTDLRARNRWRYEVGRWSFVFPLGMYAVASTTLGRAEGLSLLRGIGEGFFYVSAAAWAVVVAGLVRRARPG